MNKKKWGTKIRTTQLFANFCHDVLTHDGVVNENGKNRNLMQKELQDPLNNSQN